MTQFTAPKLSLFSSASKPHLSCTMYIITSILVKRNEHQIIIQWQTAVLAFGLVENPTMISNIANQCNEKSDSLNRNQLIRRDLSLGPQELVQGWAPFVLMHFFCIFWIVRWRFPGFETSAVVFAQSCPHIVSGRAHRSPGRSPWSL